MRDVAYLDTFIDAKEFLEGLSILLWSLECFLRQEDQEDVAKSLFFLASSCRDLGEKMEKELKSLRLEEAKDAL